MKMAWAYSHNNGDAEWIERDLRDWLTDVFEAPAIPVQPGSTRAIREHIRTEFQKEG